ncbi:UNVERIFIED_CONTAM: hypothetical protein RMT77_011789 [Armadillidium vulgare]
MEQDHNRDLSSLYLTYDLDTNHTNEAHNMSRQEISIFNAVVHSFDRYRPVKELIRMLIDEEDNDTSYLFTIVESDLPKEILQENLVKVRVTIRLVYDEIKRFIAKVNLKEDKYLFVGNFVFTCQGAIHPRQTVRRVFTSTIFSTIEKFEFSCKYLFDRDIILSCFNKLIPYNIEGYLKDHFNPKGLHRFLICYWVLKFYSDLSEQPHPDIQNNLGLFYTIFSNLSNKFILCTELAFQYSSENINEIPIFLNIQNFLENRDSSVNHTIVDELMRVSNNRINILMYFLFKVRVDELFTKYAYEILTKLIKNSRWHGIFIRYFRLLRSYVKINNYLSLIYTVLMEMWIFIEIEGDNGKYNTMWREFKQLIPFNRNHFLKNIYRKKYARKVFNLFTYQDIKLIDLFLSIDNEDIGCTFYELATTYFNLFAKVYRQCSNNNEMFLMEVIKSEDQVSHLLTRLYFTPSESNRAIELRCILWNETRPVTDWYLNMCITFTEISREYQFLCLKNRRFVVSEQLPSLNALIKIEYAEQFLSFKFINNRLLIFYKLRFVKNIRIYSREKYVPMFYLMIKSVNAERC